MTALAVSVIGLGVGTASAAAAVSSIPCSATGYGSTLAAAEHDAQLTLRGDYTILSGFTLVYDAQNPDGSWVAVESARCGIPR
ncbi:hypothetical protein ACFQ9X_42285 [Catenulispora yoronensis]